MASKNVDNAILAISMVAAFFALGLFATGNLLALGPLVVSILGFVYLTVDADQIDQWLESFRLQAGADADEDALTLLRQRYARGEIDQAEFEDRLNDLIETETIEQAVNHRDETPITERTQ